MARSTRDRVATAAQSLLLVVVCLAFPRAAHAGHLLRWTAPGDDGNVGIARRYDVRRSTAPITEANFALADTVAGAPVPSPAGARESLGVALPAPGVTYHFAIKTVDDAGNWSAISSVATLAATTAVDGDAHGRARLSAPWPNPARERSTLLLEHPSAGPADVDVFDASGRRVRPLWHGPLAAGTHLLAWDLLDGHGVRVPCGLYLVRARAGEFTATRRLVVTR